MWGWCSFAATRISLRNRSAPRAVASSDRRTLRATSPPALAILGDVDGGHLTMAEFAIDREAVGEDSLQAIQMLSLAGHGSGLLAGAPLRCGNNAVGARRSTQDDRLVSGSPGCRPRCDKPCDRPLRGALAEGGSYWGTCCAADAYSMGPVGFVAQRTRVRLGAGWAFT
jgi:hypothetical protein